MSARRYAVMTAVGPDRPGIVKEISSVIHGAGANLEDSRMAILAGEFALVVLLSGPAEAVDQVRDRVPDVERKLDFSITIKETAPRAVEAAKAAYTLEVTGVDQPGIVNSVSEILVGHEINVLSLETRLDNAAFTGTQIFTLQAQLEVPGAPAPQGLHEKLEEVCELLQLSYTLEPTPG
jgi:glycine cleavage system transcriptional repressor